MADDDGFQYDPVLKFPDLFIGKAIDSTGSPGRALIVIIGAIDTSERNLIIGRVLSDCSQFPF